MTTHDFQVLGTETLHVGRVMAVRVDQVRMPGGGAAAREVVEHPGAVAAVPMGADGTVTMIDQYRHPLGRRLWELPAGLLDEAGESPLAAARRELREEVGLVAADWSLLVDVTASPGFTDESVRVFLARELTDVGRPEAHDDEEADLTIRRIPLDEAVRMALGGEITNASTVAGLLAAHAVVAGVARPRDVDAPWRDRPTSFARRTGR